MGWVNGFFGLILLTCYMIPLTWAIDQYLTPEQYVAEVFGSNKPRQETLWITKEVASSTEKILGHAPVQLRHRYWRSGETSAWIFEEIGKEELITAGFAVTGGKLTQVRVMTYRESRGGEIRYPAFLKQYQNVELLPDYHLNRNIDGISGATLSVNAMNRMARLALYYDRISKTVTP